MERAGFIMAVLAGLFTLFLMVWQAAQGASADWVFGFLAVFWSLLMMLRLMTLTTPAPLVAVNTTLAQKIIAKLYESREEQAKRTLESAFGGSYFLFAAGVFIFAVWQIYCATLPSVETPLAQQIDAFFAADDAAAIRQNLAFGWGQGFMLLLSFLMMGFVFRSHAGQAALARPALLILAAYAAALYITYAGLGDDARGAATALDESPDRLILPYMVAGLHDDARLSLFDMLLLESGVVGLAMLGYVAFVPLGTIALSAHKARADKIMSFCGLLCAVILILSCFLPFTPGLAGLMVLCWMALFLSWGHAEKTLSPQV